MKIIVGLGNPGKEYEKNKHNAGFMLVDLLAEKMGLLWKEEKKFKAEIASENGTMLVKPLTFMNRSGETVSPLMSYYKLLPKKLGIIKKSGAKLDEILTVVHDDLDIPLGKYKVALDSRSAGHNGVQSIINNLKTQNFKRIRLGIKNEKYKMVGAEKAVLMNFDSEEAQKIKKVIEEVLDKEF